MTSSAIDSVAAPRSAAPTMPSRTPVSTSPVPSRFVRKSASPGLAPFLRQIPFGWTSPSAARPYFVSTSRIV